MAQIKEALDTGDHSLSPTRVIQKHLSNIDEDYNIPVRDYVIEFILADDEVFMVVVKKNVAC